MQVSILLDRRRNRIAAIDENKNRPEGTKAAQRCRIGQIRVPQIRNHELNVTGRMNAWTHYDLVRMPEHCLYCRGSPSARVYECNPSH